jgi:hypothetical protein
MFLHIARELTNVHLRSGTFTAVKSSTSSLVTSRTFTLWTLPATVKSLHLVVEIAVFAYGILSATSKLQTFLSRTVLPP